MTTQESQRSQGTGRRTSVDNPLTPLSELEVERYSLKKKIRRTGAPSFDDASNRKAAKPKATTSRGLPFVIHLQGGAPFHYNFRLSWGGVLRNWSLANGPSYNPQDRRLAVQTEDCPLEYGGFEGSITRGEAEVSTVMIWDQGSWRPQLGSENVDAGLRSGHLKIELSGSKMRGKWALIRIHPAASSTATTPHWLLIKERDKYERGPGDRAITEERPNSAVTGRSMKQIAAAQDRLWPLRSKGPGSSEARSSPMADLSAEQPPSATADGRGLCLDDLPREAQPESISPQLASAPHHSGGSPDWLESRHPHEQGFVIAGFTLSSEGPDRIGALLLGYYPPIRRGPRKPRHLIYAGRTGTGFRLDLRRELLHQLVQIRVPQCPFATIPKDCSHNVYWVQPVMVAQIRFASWSSDHLVRQATFRGLRHDKPASEITREAAASSAEP
ncbi:MAG: DNA polymerase ligase N-terminal domain-containing protein [Acidobacteriaceae bacterium]